VTADVLKILDERKSTHGDFADVAAMGQMTKATWKNGKNWSALTLTQREGLEMIAHKVARILSGNPDEPDHWDDIAGYAKCVSVRLVKS
jgi:hypothetical protein